MVTIVLLSLMVPDMKLFSPGKCPWHPIISSCATSPLLRRKTSFLWPLMVILLAPLHLTWVSVSLLSPEYFRTYFPITKPFVLDVLLNSLLLLSTLLFDKSLLARLPMLLRPPNTSTLSFPILSLHKQSGISLKRMHSRL